jgi:CRISPR/Cas system type I-B associated protein Csh2 (Cas7 group RAMP superfamily)
VLPPTQQAGQAVQLGQLFQKQLKDHIKSTMDAVVQTTMGSSIRPVVEKSVQDTVSASMAVKNRSQDFRKSAIQKLLQGVIQLFDTIVIGLQLLLMKLRAYYRKHYETPFRLF